MGPHVVILGGGFGGLAAARRLERRVGTEMARLTLVSDVNFMLFTPLLPGAAGGTLEPRHVVVGLREELERTELRLARVTGADPERRRVFMTDAAGARRELRYDHLIVALGSVSRTLPIPGLAEHAIGFKTLSEAIALRNRLLANLERAEAEPDPAVREALLTYVFVGAGYAGLEGIAELQDFAADVIDRYPRTRLDELRFVLVEARDRVMPEIHERLALAATAELRRRGLEILTATTVEELTADSVTLSSGEVVPSRTVCWTAGVKPVPVVADLGLPLGPGGRIVTDECLRVPDLPGVWAVGDAAAVPDPARPGEPCPPTSQHSLRQGKLAGENVARALKGSEPRPFTYRTRGVFVDMGRFKAVAEIEGTRWSGFPAWFFARSYHLLLMPGFKRKLRLMADWSVGLLFGRDATELGQLGHPPRLGEAGAFQPGGQEPSGRPAVALDDRAGA